MGNGDWSIQELAKAAATTSRTLRHYGELGILAPSRIAPNGYRYYDSDSLVRLQRILLLRELGLGLAAIADVLAGERDVETALHTHLALLEHERDRVERQIESVRTTLRKTKRGEQLMPQEAFDGFDHTQYQDEVTARWGAAAYEKGDTWWRTMSADDKAAFGSQHLDIAADYGTARRAGFARDGDEVQAIVARHYEWISIGWQGRRPTAEEFIGLGESYVADPRFAQNYDVHGAGTAEFVRDAMAAYADSTLR